MPDCVPDFVIQNPRTNKVYFIEVKFRANETFIRSELIQNYSWENTYFIVVSEGDVTHFWTISVWDNLESIKAFAGEDIEKARYYPEDKDFLLELEPNVQHYECFSIK